MSRRPPLLARLLRLGGALGTVAACIPDHGATFVRLMREADEAAGHGALLEAAQRFDEASKRALLDRDRDEARHAAARMLARAGARGDALARLDRLADESPPGPEAASALFDAASLRIATGDDDLGWHQMESVILRFPNDGASRPALYRWTAHLDDTAGAAATLAWLEKVRPALDRTERADEILYEQGLELEATGDLTHARAAFIEVATRWPYPAGALWDDALYHASAVDERMGHAADAAGDLTTMLDRREVALIAGSAERARYADAELHLGELYRDRLGDHARAREAFHALFAEFPDSKIRDRGLFEEAEILRADGDVLSACARLDALVKAVPDSRYAPCAVERCPGLSARPGPGAPSTCHAYIDRTRDPPPPPK